MYVRGCEYITYSCRGWGGVSSKILHFDCRLQGRKGGLEPVNGRKTQICKNLNVVIRDLFCWLEMIILAYGMFQRFLFCFSAIFCQKFDRFMQNALILSVFELEKCSFFSNRSEFRQKCIGTIVSGLVRQHWTQSGTENRKDYYEVKYRVRAQCAPSPRIFDKNNEILGFETFHFLGTLPLTFFIIPITL